MRPSESTMPPERYAQKYDGISIKRIDTLRSTVKSTTDRAKDSVTSTGYHRCFSLIDPARMTGRTGRTHGASMVKIPAMKEISARVIFLRN